MKRIHIFLFLFVTCFILNGCGAQNPSDSGPEAKDHTTATGNTTLPESTITWFNTEYFNSGDSVNMRNKPKTIAFYESMTKLLLPCFSGSTLR